MVEKRCTRLVGTIKDILIKIDKFLFPVDFMVLDIEANPKIPLILERPLIKIIRMLVDIDTGQVIVRIKGHEACFKVTDICNTKHNQDIDVKPSLVERQPNLFYSFLVSLLNLINYRSFGSKL